MAEAYPETHVIIIGGTSVNEPTHDDSPFNFINSGCWRAKGYPKGTVRVLFYTPSYEKRALNEKLERESPKVDRSKLIVHTTFLGIDKFHIGCGRDKDYFLKVVKNSQAVTGFSLSTISSASDLSDELNKFHSIETLEYFGHSNFEKFLLDYGIDGYRRGQDTWGDDEARDVDRATVFAGGAKFISYGCYQGRPLGLAEKLRNRWYIEAIGAEEKTEFEQVTDPSRWCPTTTGDWYRYPAWTTEDNAPPREKTTAPREPTGVASRMPPGATPTDQGEYKSVRVDKDTTLSGIAQDEYGTWELWPLIWDLNRSDIGPNPNVLQTVRGRFLKVRLPLDRYTPEQIANAKRRAPTWRSLRISPPR